MTASEILRATAAGVFALAIAAVLLLGGVAGCKSFERYQKRQDALNSVKINHTKIKYYEQQKDIERKKADIRVIHAIGIRDAQDHIAKTLTPLYVQFEMSEALREIATSGKNNTVVYIPSGASGVPLVSTTNQPQVYGGETDKN